MKKNSAVINKHAAIFNRKGLEDVQRERLDLGERKSHDYGSAMDAIAIGGVRGVAFRMMDKAARILSLTDPLLTAKVSDESLRDTFSDMGNYSDYGVCLIDGTWGEIPKKAKRKVAKK